MIVYAIINLVNKKTYIGQTVGTFNERYCSGKWWKYTNNKRLKNDVKRYGKNNFKVKILKKNIKNIEELNKLEHIYAKKHKAYFPYGYNLIGCGKNKFLLEKHKKNLSKIRIGNYKPKNKILSKYCGVSFDKKHKKYNCKFTNKLLNRSRYYIYEKQAAVAHDLISLYLYKDNCTLNFPNKLKKYKKINLKFFYKNFLKRKKNDLKRNTNIIEKEKLKKMCKFLSSKDIGKILNRNYRYVDFWIKKHKIEKYKKGFLLKKRNAEYRERFLKKYNSLILKRRVTNIV